MEYNRLFNGYKNLKENINQEPDQTINAEPPKQLPKEPTSAIINIHRLNVRERPGTDSPVMCILSEGDEILVEDTNGDWSCIYTSFGTKGYVMNAHIKEV